MSKQSVVSTADAAGCYIFAAALRSSDHCLALDASGPFTLFAPLDSAFRSFSPVALDSLLRRERDKLHLVLGHHFALGLHACATVAGKRTRLPMHLGGEVLLDGGGSHLKANGARVIRPDLTARNGIVHGIDALLWPRELAVAVGAP